MSNEQPVAWETPYFESTRSGDLTPICVWGERHEDDWKPLYPASALDAAFKRGLEEAAELQPHHLDDWNEDHGDVLWFHFPIQEPPWVGSPLSKDFDPDWHQWWLPLPNGNAVDAAIRALAEEPERNNNAHRT